MAGAKADDRPAAIKLSGVRLRLQRHFWTKPVHILRGVDLKIAEGEIFGFLGPNGAGKTTTMKALLGLMRPDAGDIKIFGRPIADPNIRKRIGFMPERAYFPAQLSAFEYIRQHAWLAEVGRDQVSRRVAEVLEKVGMADRQHRRLDECSKGMLQRVGLAQALVGDPDLIVLDEPMSGLDPEGRRDMHDLIRNLGAQGKTVFFSTHVLPDVELLCDRIGILIGGKVTRLGRVADVATSGAPENKAVVHVAFDVPADTEAEAIATVRAGGMDVSQTEDILQLKLPDLDSANLTVQRALTAGLKLRELTSRAPDLESLFLREIEKKTPNPDDAP